MSVRFSLGIGTTPILCSRHTHATWRHSSAHSKAQVRGYTTSPINPFSVLGIPYDASVDEIKYAYRKMALRYHPDRPGGDAAKMRTITEAYEELVNGNNFSSAYKFWSKGAYNTARARYHNRHNTAEQDQWASHARYSTRAGGAEEKEESGFHDWYKRQHFKMDTDFSEEQQAYDYFGWGGRNRAWWKEQTSYEKQQELREKQTKARINQKDPFGLKTNKIIIGVGAADGTLKNW